MKIRYFRNDDSHYDYEVEITAYFCPNCGKKNVYEDQSEGDYYEGSSLFCKSCNFTFTMPSRIIDDNMNWITKDIKLIKYDHGSSKHRLF